MVYNKLKQLIFFSLLLINLCAFSQDNERIEQLKNKLETIIPDSPGLNQKININIKQSTLTEFLMAVTEVHKVNISVSPELNQISIVNNFSDVMVSDVIIFFCKEYNLTIDFTGNILSIKKYQKPVETPKEKKIDINYNSNENKLSLNIKDDKLYDVFKRITDVSGKNLVFAQGLETKTLTSYIKDMPFEDALDKLALANNLEVSKTKDNFYLFDSYNNETPISSNQKDQPRASRPIKNRKSNFFFTVLDFDKKLLEVDFENIPIASIVYDIGNELNLNMFYSSPIEGIGNTSLKAKNITFDQLLEKLFESKTEVSLNQQQTNSQPNNFNNNSQEQNNLSSYSYAKKDNIYIFGLKNQLVVRNIKTVHLMHRSIELLSDPSKEGRSAGRLNNLNTFNNFSSNNQSNSNSNYSNTESPYQNKSGGSIVDIFPKEIINGLDIKVDTELNSFIVSGPSENISRFEDFVTYIDKPVPVVLIEVMLLEVSRSATIETGISAGIGENPVTTSGTIFPNSDITLGAETLNKIINRFDGFGSLNVGNLVPNFYLSLRALETNGNINIRSTPRLSTLNGHRAFLSIGETTYYVVTNQNYYGSQIPQTSEIKNYQPIDAELSLTLKPLISGDGQITMDIKVIQSSFNGQKVDKDAPPGINSREFTSIIRVKDQDIIVLGGLEEKVKNDTGSGVPLLARIPIIKWLFSSRKREDSKKKLTVLIKPTVIY